MTDKTEKSDHFTSRWGFILAAMGAAVGTGNIWRFPKEVALNGGGAFLVAWVIFLFLWSIPLLIAEFAIGKNTRMGTIGSFKTMLGKKYAWMGTWMVWVSAAIQFYYSVVMGWTMFYFYKAISGGLNKDVDTVAMWDNFIANPWIVIFFQMTAIALSAYVVLKGISKGIERLNKVLLPALIVLLGIAAIWAVSLPGAINGLRFMFIPRFEKLGTGEIWIRAMAQSAWSCSAGMGMAITYAVYMKKKEDITLNAFITGLGNNSVSLIAGIAVMCTVFALAPSTMAGFEAIEVGGTGLTFIHLTKLFIQMPMGLFIAAIFFLAMGFAAITSSVAGFEIAVRNFMDYGLTRIKAVKVVTLAVAALGIPSAMSLHFLENQDVVWGTGLLMSGLFVSFAVTKYGANRFRNELVNTKWNDLYIGKWWVFIIKYVIPLEFVALLLWYMRDTYNASKFTFASMIFQWLVGLILIICFNDKIQERFKRRVDVDDMVDDPEAGKEGEDEGLPVVEAKLAKKAASKDKGGE